MENVSIVALEPWGNQDFDIGDVYSGAKNGVWIYLVYCKRDDLPFDMEDLLDKYRELYPDGYVDEEYLLTFETMLDAAGIKWSRLPDQCFTVYSTLY